MKQFFAKSCKSNPFTLREKLECFGDVTGVIKMIQETHEASMMLSFPKGTILKLMAVVYGQEFPDINPSVQAGVGELTNVVYGLMKKDLNEAGHRLKMALPEVSLPPAYGKLTEGYGKTIEIAMSMDDGPFALTISEVRS